MLLAHRMLRGPAAARTFSSSRSFSLSALVGRRRYADSTSPCPVNPKIRNGRHCCRSCPSIQQQQQLVGCRSSSPPARQLCRAAAAAAEAVTSSTAGEATMTAPGAHQACTGSSMLGGIVSPLLLAHVTCVTLQHPLLHRQTPPTLFKCRQHQQQLQQQRALTCGQCGVSPAGAGPDPGGHL
jgi:hypothetical protein